MKKIFLILISLFILSCDKDGIEDTLESSEEVNIEECISQPSLEEELYMASVKAEYDENQGFNRNANELIRVPLKIHIIRKSDSTLGYTESKLNTALERVNEQYSEGNIEFFICEEINYINSDEFYNFQTNEQYDLTNSTEVDYAINIYFAQTVNSGGSSLCGYAYYPGGPKVVIMKNSCSDNGSTLAHELGHSYGIRHTHGVGQGFENVDGSNCDTSGDYVCDTPADPKLNFSVVNSNCEYTGNAVDGNNDPYNPDPKNIMSYSRKNCRTLFTPGQFERARMFAQSSSRIDLECPDEVAAQIWNTTYPIQVSGSGDDSIIAFSFQTNILFIVVYDQYIHEIERFEDINATQFSIDTTDYEPGLYYFSITHEL